MVTIPIGNEEEWGSIASDPNIRACLRKIAMTILGDINPKTVDLYRQKVEAQRSFIARYKGRVVAIDSEIGCLDLLVDKLPMDGEGGAFRAMMVQRKTALMIEREETIEKAEKVPGEIESSERLLREVETQLANAGFLMAIVEKAEDAEGGIHRVADEPRGSGDNGGDPDPLCEV